MANELDKDGSPSPSKLALELGLTAEEALQLRRDVENVRCSSPQRWIMGPPIQLKDRPCKK